MLKATLSGEDVYGRHSIAGVRTTYTARRLRRLRSAEHSFIHRSKNGVYDPLTFYHIFDLLMQVTPGEDFTTPEFLALLRAEKPQLVWDATVVGRVLTDIAETLDEAYGRAVLGYTKRWSGMSFDTSAHPENRAAMARLHEDLFLLAEKTIQDELAGVFAKRMNSPLLQCPSVMSMAA